jgi:hypothetical protein
MRLRLQSQEGETGPGFAMNEAVRSMQAPNVAEALVEQM